MTDTLQQRIETKTGRVAVIGLGTLGLPLAVEVARVGVPVTGIEADARKVEAVNAGRSAIPDVPSETMAPLVTQVAALAVSPAEMAIYRATARRRKAQEEQALARRRERAWTRARQAASLLREQFGATRVAVFGSLAHKEAFTPWSDVDIAAWGIHPDDTWRAVGAVMDLDAEIEINLVDVSTARPSVLAAIEREGLAV